MNEVSIIINGVRYDAVANILPNDCYGKDGLLHTAANSPDPQVGANMLISYFVANPEAMRIFSNAIEFANNKLNKRRTNLN